MSRDIKYRAYLKGFKKMCVVKSIDFQMGTLWARHGFKDTSPIYDFIGDHAVPLMQYTGINDKNGVGVYEGDIVTALIDTPPMQHAPLGDSVYIKGAVIFQYGSFLVDGEYLWGEHLYSIEVIGNIHENKELLK